MPIMDESDVSLPKATLSKMIRELVPGDLRVRQDSLDMLIDCCTEFVNLLSSESNDVSSRENKNTIHAEHVLNALEELGFSEFIPEVRETWDLWKQDSKQKTTNLRPRGHKTNAEAAGYTEEEQIVLQQMLFADARARSNTLHDPSSCYVQEMGHKDGSGIVDLSSSPSIGGGIQASQNSNIYTNFASRSDILPIQPLTIPPMSSDFHPSVISPVGLTTQSPPPVPSVDPSGAVSCVQSPPQSTAVSQQVLDFSHISMSQPVILVHNGVQQSVSWQMLISQVAMLPQFSSLQQQSVQNAECSAPMDFLLQMPECSQIPALQPSFPDSICTSCPQSQETEPEEIDLSQEPLLSRSPAEGNPSTFSDHHL